LRKRSNPASGRTAKATDRAQQNGIRRLGGRHGLVGHWDAMPIDCGTADKPLGNRELEAAGVGQPVDDSAHLAHDLRANTIAR
jgi:hypothetical protein